MVAERSGVFAHLVVNDGKGAIACYENALGAQVLGTHMADDQKRVMHSTLSINGGEVMLCDALPEFGNMFMQPPRTLGGTSVTLHLSVDDVDAHFAKAIDAAASSVVPPEDMFWGERYAKFEDPYGHVRSLGGGLQQGTAA